MDPTPIPMIMTHRMLLRGVVLMAGGTEMARQIGLCAENAANTCR